MSSKFQNVMLIGIAIVVIALFLRQPEKQIPIVQDIQVTQPKERSIIVTGRGEVTAKIDKAEFVIAFETDEKELADAKIKNEETYIDTIMLLKQYAIEDKDISEYHQVEIKTGYTTANGKKPIGYIIHRSLKVTLHSLEELEPLFIDLQAAGIYDIENIFLSVSDIDGYQERALQLAVENANQKAKAVGRNINREIGQAISVNANSIYGDNNAGILSFDTLNTFFENKTSTWQKHFSVPEIAIYFYVTVEYELK